ncbi:MAG: FecR domain-containing protein, partial [Gammaproteobacteria bacterium]|nr:FecR domain-containing protein [Gammaproteobacteria bacterium]
MKRTPYTMLITLLRWSLLATLLLGFAAQAEPVARVLMANGDVRAIQSDQSVRALNRGDMLYAGDTIRTGKTSSAQFRFTDGALIALRAESEFNIEQHHYNEQTPQQNEQSGQLVRGGLRAITGAIGRERPEAVNMRTPVATIGIRGTVYETIYIPPGGHPALPGVESGHYTVVLRGRVAISNAGGELVIGDGEIAFVRDANTPPVLRPDLSALFARFAALENVEEIIAELQEDAVKLQDILNVLTETALPEPGPTAGPFGFIAVQEWPDGPGTSYSGSFFNQAVEMDGELLISAENGTGDIQTF